VADRVDLEKSLVDSWSKSSGKRLDFAEQSTVQLTRLSPLSWALEWFIVEWIFLAQSWLEAPSTGASEVAE